MKQLLLWWFSPKSAYSIFKIPIGLIFAVILILSIIGNFQDFIIAFKSEPLFTGAFLFLLPIFIFVFFADTIFAGGLIYLPYNTFAEEQSGWKALFKGIGILLAVFIVLRLLRLFIFSGWD